MTPSEPRYFEIDKYTLSGDSFKNLKNWLWHCYHQFTIQFPSDKFSGDNLIMMWKSDLIKLLENKEENGI